MGNTRTNHTVVKLRLTDRTRVHLFIISESYRLSQDKTVYNLYSGVSIYFCPLFVFLLCCPVVQSVRDCVEVVLVLVPG